MVVLRCFLLLSLQVAPDPAAAQDRSGGGWAAQVRSGTATATQLRLEGDGQRTRVRIVVDRAISASIFTLGDPYRAIVDVAGLEFQLPAGSGRTGHGLVAGYRYGQFEAGRSRIVIDATGPLLIENAQLVPAGGREPQHLSFELVRISPERFAALAGNAPAPPKLRSAQHDADDETAEVAPAAPTGTKQRPVIVIDPGHGGLDPGTVATSNITEKSVVLAVALQLRNLLQQSRRFDVHMTRANDTFVSLDRRLAVSRQRNADLFISIHADAIGEKELAGAIRGATVYTMSEKASDEAARQLAEKENAVDRLAGLDSVPASDEDQVRSILIDLVRRETSNYAAEFRNHLIGHLRAKVPLSKEPMRSAAFKVLKQAQTPAVLIELGYMSNPEDLARLSKPEWQQQLAQAIAASVDIYFAQRTARAR